MKPVVVDSNVILDVATDDPNWGAWSADNLEKLADEAILVINPLIYAEVSVGFQRIEELEQLLGDELFHREPLPWAAGFLAGKAFLTYRRQTGTRRSPLPDFYIGAHAAVRDYRLLTRDRSRYETYFPSIDVIGPQRAP